MTYSDVGLKNQYSLWWSSAQGNRKKIEHVGRGGGDRTGLSSYSNMGFDSTRGEKKVRVVDCTPEIILVKPEK